MEAIERPDTVVMKPEQWRALKRVLRRVSHLEHPGRNRAEKRANWRRYRRTTR